MYWMAGAISNAVRGGQWYAWLGKEDDFPLGSDPLNETIYGLTVFVATGSVWLAMASAVAMACGARPGWGDYIGALFGRIVAMKENRFIDAMIVGLKRWPRLWGGAGLMLRGLWWGICLATPFLIAGYSAGWWFLLAGASMPLSYWAAAGWARIRVGGDWSGAAWALGEIFHGAVLWSALGGL